jgi:membrane protease YdiL (CAAX protease family)
MSEAQTTMKSLKFRLTLYGMFLLCGFSVFAISYLSPELSVGSGTLIAIFFLAAWVLNRSSRFRIYWKVFFAFFVFSFLWFTRHTILDSALVQPFYKTLNGNVTAQLIDSALIIVPIILLTLASGDKLPTIFLQRGNVRLGLIVGLIVFIVFFLVSGAVAVQFIGMSPGGFLFLTPYLLVLALVNGFKEELWFRGLFLNKYEPLLGFRLSNFLQAPIFAASLIEAEFASALIGIVLVSFVLGLGLGYLMRRTGSILGPSLCEAGSVIPIFLVALSSLKP